MAIAQGTQSGSGPAEKPTTGTLVVVRHGATEWSESGRHTSRTDLPLVPAGRRRAQGLARVLDRKDFARVLCSPLRRALETCELAGFGGEGVEIYEDLREWDYGDYEGLTTPEIWREWPGWLLWRDGCPGGESPAQVAARADRVIGLLDERDTIAFAHGHLLRVLAARWIGLGPEGGGRLALSPARLSKLGYERAQRVIEHWNVDSL